MSTGFVTYPGIDYIRWADYTQGHGTRPNRAMVEMVPQSNPISERGTLKFRFNNVVVDIPNMRPDWGQAKWDGDGHLVRVMLLDRRWCWQAGGVISGRYNRRKPDGTLVTSTQKNPRQLAELLLRAMGERRYIVTGLPTEPRPEIDWDFAHPAYELSVLCERYGCRVVLGLGNDPVTIWRLGRGRAVPNDGTVASQSFRVDSPEKPDSLMVVWDETLWDARLKLKAVGLDNDGSIKPIDDLSYAPDDGWSSEGPKELDKITDAVDRRLARRSVYRWYQVDSMFDGSLDLPIMKAKDDDIPKESKADKKAEKDRKAGTIGTSKGITTLRLGDISWVLPINDFRSTFYTDAAGNVFREKPEIRGKYYRRIADEEVDPVSHTNTNDVLDIPFSLDRATGIVRFDRPVYQMLSTDEYEPATLTLHTSFAVNDPDRGQKFRYTYTRNLGGKCGTGPKKLERDDMHGVVLVTYKESESDTSIVEIDTITTNQKDLDNEAIRELNARQAEYQIEGGWTVVYNGIRDFRLDGVRRQVRFSSHFDAESVRGGARTMISLNSEADPYAVTYRENRAIEDRIVAAQTARKLFRDRYKNARREKAS